MSDRNQYFKVMEVRQITGYAKLDCLKALKKMNWDIDEATKYLKENPPVHICMDYVKELKYIGFWRSEDEEYWPDPAWFVDHNWDKQLRRYVIWYLKAGKVLSASPGSSWCRFRCSKRSVGSVTLTDGVYIWPEGLAHYLEEHEIRLPEEFINHTLKNVKIEVNYNEMAINCDWWENQKGWTEGNSYLCPALKNL